MARNGITTHAHQAGRVLLPVLGAGILLLCMAPGCARNGGTEEDSLDSTLVRSEQLLDRGGVVAARQRLLEGLRAAEGEWKGAQAAGAYRMLADLSVQTAHLDSALLFYAKAEESYRGRMQRLEAFQMALASVSVWRLMQRNQDALTQASEALRLATLFGDSAAVNEIRWALLDLYRVLEQPAEMAGIVSAVQATARRLNEPRSEARLSFILGKAASDRGEIEIAGNHLLQCLALAGKAKDSLLAADALLVLAGTFEQAGRLREAQDSYVSVLQNWNASGSPSRLHAILRLGNLYLRSGQKGTAATYFETAAKLAQTSSNAVAEGYALLQWGHSLGPVNPAEAGALFRRAYDGLRKTGHPRGCAYALISMGQLAERENKVTDAVQIYRAALKAQESALAGRQHDDPWLGCEEAVFGPGGADAYGALVGILLQTGKTQEAFWYQERCNARGLAEDLAAWNPRTEVYRIDSTLQSHLYQRALHVGAERQLEELASSPRGTPLLLEEVQRVMSRLEENIAASGERTRHIDPRLIPVADMDGISVAEAQKALPGDATLLVYLPTPRALYACVVTPAGSSVHMAAVSPAHVTVLADEYLRECTRRTQSADSAGQSFRSQDLYLQDLTRGLYEALILPVESMLKPGSRLLVVLPPDMPLLSLAGLRRGGSPGTPALVERLAVSYLPTVRFLQLQKPLSAPPRRIVALGARSTTRWDVEYELRDITAFYRDARMLFGKEATLASLRSVRGDLLHLAAEIRFSSRRPVTGTVLLGDGLALDGTTQVSLGAIFSIPAASAVIVSNISGRLPTADRTLAAAFLANGSSAVVLHAAPLTRKAKKVFGESFYTALQSGSSVPAAVRAAQGIMVRSRELSAPHYWAPLMVWGGEPR